MPPGVDSWEDFPTKGNILCTQQFSAPSTASSRSDPLEVTAYPGHWSHQCIHNFKTRIAVWVIFSYDTRMDMLSFCSFESQPLNEKTMSLQTTKHLIEVDRKTRFRLMVSVCSLVVECWRTSVGLSHTIQKVE